MQEREEFRHDYCIVIVTYNRLELLKECIDAALGQSLPGKVLVINNASTDGTDLWLQNRAAGEERLTVVTEKENLGGAGGFHDGLKTAVESGAAWSCLIDDDAMLAPDFMERILTEAGKHLEISAYSGTVKTNGTIVTSHRRRLKHGTGEKEKDVPEEEYCQENFVCNLASFCGLVIRNELVRETGLPCTDFFIWYDDSEFCMRLEGRTEILNVCAAELNHKTKLSGIGNERLEKLPFRRYYGFRNAIYSFKKHGYGWQERDLIIWLLGSSIKDLMNRKIPKEVSIYNARLRVRSIWDGIAGKLGRRN